MDRVEPHSFTTAPARERRPRSRWGLVVGLAVVLVAVLGGVGTVLLRDGDGDGGDTAVQAGAALGDGRQGRDAMEMPEAMVGSWEGTVTQESTSTTYTVEMTLAATATERQVGTVSYPTLDCEGHYTLQAVDDDGVTLVEHITGGTGNCVDAIAITLSAVDENHLSYSFNYAGNPEDGQATLTRTG